METGKSSIRREAEGGFYTGYSSPGHDFDFGRFERTGEYTRAKDIENSKIRNPGQLNLKTFTTPGIT